MEEKPEFMAMLDKVRVSMAELFNMANEVPKTAMHEISSEADYNGQEMEDVGVDGCDCADLVAWSTNLSVIADRDEAVKRLGVLLLRQSKRLRIHGNGTVKTQRRMGSAAFPRCRLFAQEGAMTDPAQIRAKISTMETVTLRHDPLAVPEVHQSNVAAMSVIGSSTGPVCRVHIYTNG